MSTASGNGGRRVLHDYPSNSSIPRKVDHHPPSAVSLDAGNALRASRQKQTKRDEVSDQADHLVVCLIGQAFFPYNGRE